VVGGQGTGILTIQDGGAATSGGGSVGLLAGANGMVLDAHSIQPYYAGRVAGAAGMTVRVETRDKEVELKAA